MNSLSIIGYLAADPKSIGNTASFTILHKPFKGETLTIDCYVENQDVPTVMKYLKKGKQVSVSGELSVKAKDNRAYLKLQRCRFWFVGGAADVKPTAKLEVIRHDTGLTESDWVDDMGNGDADTDAPKF